MTTLDKRDLEIKKLKKIIRFLKEENEYLKSINYRLDLLEEIKGSYSVLLNPPLKDFSTTINQKACAFKLDMNDILCIQADLKTKWIYFKKKLESVSGERHVSDRLSFTGKIKEFCKDYDQSMSHLCIVSRSYAVNPSYYSLDSNQLVLNDKLSSRDACNNIRITKKYIGNFIRHKEMLSGIRSFQKIEIRAK